MQSLKNKETSKTQRILEGFTQNPFKWMLIFYVIITTYFGTWLIVQGILHLKYDSATPQIEQVPIGNGFVYLTQNKKILDSSGNIIVPQGLEKIKIAGNTIYGHYHDSQQGTLYFICTKGEDCSKTLKYNKEEYRAALQKKRIFSLPFPFSFPFFEDHVSLVTSEWLSKKILFQNAPDKPFLRATDADKRIDESLEFFWEVGRGIIKYTSYGVYALILFLIIIIYLATYFYKTICTEAKNIKVSKPIVFLWRKVLVGLIKTYFYSVSFIVTLLVILAELNQ